jgi:hypothetical protein
VGITDDEHDAKAIDALIAAVLAELDQAPAHLIALLSLSGCVHSLHLPAIAELSADADDAAIRRQSSTRSSASTLPHNCGGASE